MAIAVLSYHLVRLTSYSESHLLIFPPLLLFVSWFKILQNYYLEENYSKSILFRALRQAAEVIMTNPAALQVFTNNINARLTVKLNCLLFSVEISADFEQHFGRE